MEDRVIFGLDLSANLKVGVTEDVLKQAKYFGLFCFKVITEKLTSTKTVFSRNWQKNLKTNFKCAIELATSFKDSSLLLMLLILLF